MSQDILPSRIVYTPLSDTEKKSEYEVVDVLYYPSNVSMFDEDRVNANKLNLHSFFHKKKNKFSDHVYDVYDLADVTNSREKEFVRVTRNLLRLVEEEKKSVDPDALNGTHLLQMLSWKK